VGIADGRVDPGALMLTNIKPEKTASGGEKGGFWVLFKLEDIEMKLNVVLEPSDEGGFTVYVPALPGCISEGETEEEALKNIREAIELYLENYEEDRTPTGNTVIIKELSL
jgi:predicted RNase H-like HicB family nuclease